MSSIITDTHALIWYVNDTNDLSADALNAFEAAEQSGSIIYVPAIVIVELRYLVEKARDITQDDYRIIVELLKDPQSVVTLAPLDLNVAEALSQIPRFTVPDMPDRIISATALALNLPLVTRDHKIRALSNITTIW